MSKKILWLDNDLAYIAPYVEILQNHGFEVTCASTITEAEKALTESYDLFILDVMIPTKTEHEEEVYKPEETDAGRETGLVFYAKMKERVDATDCKWLVLTVRLDEPILKEFLAKGLRREWYDTKMNLRVARTFLGRVQGILAENTN